ncbi:MAG: cupin domain-containing protein [Chloroflexi bacterium]|nr:cupin domain-containing protein [Chloroflexota bacterium]
MENFRDYREFTGSRSDKFYKSTMFQSSRLLLGLNCLDPGQEQHVHVHGDQDKFYYVVEGTGEFTVGAERYAAETGIVVWAPAGVEHGVTNKGSERLVLLVGIAS